MLFILIFLSLINFETNSQLCFKVIEENGTGIPYATIMDTKFSFSTFSDENGNICIESDEIIDSLKISSVGFETVTVASIAVNKVIVLKKRIIDLAEVTVLKRKIKKNKLGNLSKLKCTHSISVNSNKIIYTYIENKDRLKNAYFESIKFGFHKGNKIYKFRIGFYETGVLPNGKLLNNEDIIFNGNNSFGQEINLIDKDISFPEGGCWVSIQSIGYYKDTDEFITNINGKYGKARFKNTKSSKIDNIESLAPMVCTVKEERKYDTLTNNKSSFIPWSGNFSRNRHPMLEFKIIY